MIGIALKGVSTLGTPIDWCAEDMSTVILPRVALYVAEAAVARPGRFGVSRTQ